MYKRLHDTIPESRKLGKISDFAFRCWTVGLTKADWFGRLSADPEKFKSICFANRSSTPENEIMAALDELADVGGTGLLHLYRDEDGERYLVFHKHGTSNPTGGWKTKPKKYPAPPDGICRCVMYKQDEERKSIAGKRFRFFKGLFSTDQSQVATGQSFATDQCSSPAPLLSSPSPLFSSSGEGTGEGEFAKLCDEFTSLTGRPALAVTDPVELMGRIKGFLKVRGTAPMLQVMREKTSELIQRSGRPPNSLQYFVPIFEDDRLFNGGPDGSSAGRHLNAGAKAVLGHFALKPGELDEKMRQRIADRERRESEAQGGGRAEDRGHGEVAPQGDEVPGPEKV